MKRLRLEDIAPFRQGCCTDEEDIWLLNLDMVESNTGNIIDFQIVSKEEIGSSTIAFDINNILYSKLRPYLNKVVLPKRSGYATSEMIPLMPKQNIVTREYLTYFLRSPRFVEYINSKTAGAKMPRANTRDLKEVLVPCPTIEKQRFIVEQIDKIRIIIELYKQEIEQLDLLMKARFVEMFGVPGTDINGWEVKKLGDCCEINPKKGKDSRLTPGIEVSFVPMSAVSENGAIDPSDTRMYDDVKTGFTYFAENDVLMAKITPCMENGKGAVAVDLKNGIGFGSTEFHVLRPIRGISNSYWIYVLTSIKTFREDAASNMTGSAGQRRVPATFLENFKISIPPIELQNQFADFVRAVDKSKVEVQKALDKTQMLFDSLMQQYFG